MNRPLTLTETEGASAPSIRQRLEAEIERLIGLLDELDGDENLEPSVSAIGYVVMDDREGDPCDDGEPGTDDEPALGWGTSYGSDDRPWPQGWGNPWRYGDNEE